VARSVTAHAAASQPPDNSADAGRVAMPFDQIVEA
jgi:hypothetical protein